jgi:hypothetical protein
MMQIATLPIPTPTRIQSQYRHAFALADFAARFNLIQRIRQEASMSAIHLGYRITEVYISERRPSYDDSWNACLDIKVDARVTPAQLTMRLWWRRNICTYENPIDAMAPFYLSTRPFITRREK